MAGSVSVPSNRVNRNSAAENTQKNSDVAYLFSTSLSLAFSFSVSLSLSIFLLILLPQSFISFFLFCSMGILVKVAGGVLAISFLTFVAFFGRLPALR